MLTPGRNESLPFASTLCGACYDACPVKINIPEVLIHLRQTVRHPVAERAAMRVLAGCDVAAEAVPGGAAGGPGRRRPHPRRRHAGRRAATAAVAGLAVDGDPRRAAAGQGDLRGLVGP